MANYNGWTNYETWNVALWLDNEEGSQSYYAEMAQECLKNAVSTDYLTEKEVATQNLSEMIKSEFEENTPTVTGCYADLLNASLSEVNWYEIASNLIEDAQNE